MLWLVPEPQLKEENILLVTDSVVSFWYEIYSVYQFLKVTFLLLLS